MKKIINYFLLIIIICILSSCGHAKNVETVNLGRYVMSKVKDDTRMPPSILIKEDSIMFTHTPYSSYMNIGKDIIEE